MCRVIEKREREDEAKAALFRNLKLLRRGYLSLFAHHLQHSERRDEQHKLKLDRASQFADF